MRLPAKCRPELCVGDDPLKPFLHHPWLDVETRTLTVIDGRCCVCLPVAIAATDLSGPVTAEALKMARRNSRGQRSIHCGSKNYTIGSETLPRPSTVPLTSEWRRYIPQPDGGVRVTINARLLMNMQRAFGSSYVRLTLRPALENTVNSAMLVHPEGEHPWNGSHPAAFGILMPCYTEA